MDRLPLVALAALAALAACRDEPQRAGGGGRSRVDSVKARPGDRPDPAAWCDVFHRRADAPAFSWPALTAEPPAARAGEWRWINLWATWCKPCVEEMPHLAAWSGGLGRPVAMLLVSADESDEVVASFRAAHPATPDSLRMADPDALAAWLQGLGIAGAGLPVQLFVDPAGKLRCVRASAVEETDLPAIESVVAGS